MSVIAIRKPVDHVTSGGEATSPSALTKSVPANQKSIDALPLGSGEWKVEGIPGLYIRCRAQSKTFRIARRVKGKLIKQTLARAENAIEEGPISMKEAKELMAKGAFAGVGGQKSAAGGVTFAQAFHRYIEQKTLAEASLKLYRRNFSEHLNTLHDQRLSEIGEDRVGMRTLQQQMRKDHGHSAANQVVRLVSAVYNWQRKVDRSLPESPTTACDLDEIKARDWALDDSQLKAWWSATEKTEDGELTKLGVKTLLPIKRGYWLTSLFAGARPMSVENLKWTDINFDRRTILFRYNKGNPPYVVPMADTLHDILTSYRDSELVPPDEWVFPSGQNKTGHLTEVKNHLDGVTAKYRLRHTFKTRLTQLGFTNEQGKMLMGHSLGGDVATGYISAPLLIESLRPVVNALAGEYLRALNVTSADLQFSRA
jgi:integrase